MSFTVHELTNPSTEFGPIIEVEAAAYSNPPSAFWKAMAGPMKNNSLSEVTERQALWHSMDPTSRWIYAKDDETNEVVGAMNWNFHETDPFASGSEGPPIYWWEGEFAG